MKFILYFVYAFLVLDVICLNVLFFPDDLEIIVYWY